MVLSSGLIWTLLLCCIAVDASAAHRLAKKQNCRMPPTGLWGIELYEPPSNPTVLVYGYLLLTSSFKNTYSGKHHCIAADRPSTSPGLLGTALVFPMDGSWSLKMHLVGMYETDSCFLYGVLVSHELGVVDDFRWIYDGDTMEGIFVASVEGESVYNDYAKHSLTLLEATDATDLDAALDAFLDQDPTDKP